MAQASILKLKQYRNKKGMTQKELSEALGVSPSLISMYEVGEREPSLYMLVRMSNYFGVSIDEFLGKNEIMDELILATQGEEKSSLRGAFEAMTQKLIADVVSAPTGDVNPAIIQEIRENLRALGEV